MSQFHEVSVAIERACDPFPTCKLNARRTIYRCEDRRRVLPDNRVTVRVSRPKAEACRCSPTNNFAEPRSIKEYMIILDGHPMLTPEIKGIWIAFEADANCFKHPVCGAL